MVVQVVELTCWQEFAAREFLMADIGDNPRGLLEHLLSPLGVGSSCVASGSTAMTSPLSRYACQIPVLFFPFVSFCDLLSRHELRGWKF